MSQRPAFDPAAYCAALADGIRSYLQTSDTTHGIKPSGPNRLIDGRDRRVEWRAAANDHAERAMTQYRHAIAIAGVAFNVGPAPAVTAQAQKRNEARAAAWVANFGRTIGQLWYLADRGALANLVDRNLDELTPAELHALYEYAIEQYQGLIARLGSEPSFLQRLSFPLVSTRVVDDMLARPEFRDLGLAVIRHAVTHNPAAPADALADTLVRITALRDDARYSDFTDGVIKHVAINNPKNPTTFLDALRSRVAALAEQPEFATFTPRALMHAAVNYPTRTEAFLRQTLRGFATLRANPDFADVTDSVLQHAALSYPACSVQYVERYRELHHELAQSSYRDLGSHALRTAAMHHQEQPYAFLEDVRIRLGSVCADERFAVLPHHELQRISTSYSDPTTYLAEVLRNAEALAPAFPAASRAQLVRFCAYYPTRTTALVGGEAVTALDTARVHDLRTVSRSVTMSR
jgi:hypothetical protein